MPESLLAILKFCFLALLWLFFVRVLWAVWAEVNAPPAAKAVPQRSAPVATPAPDTARLRIVEPAERRGTVFDLGSELTVGRASGCQVSLPDDTYVSQLHARLFRQDGRVWVEDLGSTNGTYVNAKAVAAPVALSRGDRIQVGRTVLEVTR